VDLAGVDDSIVKKASEAGYFTKGKAEKKQGEEAFFKQGEKPEVRTTNRAPGIELTIV
jgi:large subunit ribosomal protein L6e